MSDFITHIESRCDDVDSSSALVEISELNIVEADNINILIFDCIKKIRMSKLELSIEEIRQAKDELIRMSNDKKQRELYDMRANSLRDKISELNAAERKGIEKGKEEGRKEEKIKIARNMKLSGLDTDTIANITNLSPDEIDKL